MRTCPARVLMLILVGLLLASGCSRGPETEQASGTGERTTLIGPVAAAKGSYGNCLSTPVVFAEGYGLTGAEATVFSGLRGTPGVESFVSPYDGTLIDGYPVYQNPSVNEWQADWTVGASWGGAVPVEVDWSDNLVRQTWTDRSKLRVEVILTTPLTPGHALQGYNMYSLGGSRQDEVFVTNTTRYTAEFATVYSNVARLTIEKLDVPGGAPVALVYSSACYERYFVDGRTDAYSAEVNMGGKCIYGYNWDIGASPVDTKSGWYRLTFSLDPGAAYTDESGNSYSYGRNTELAGLNPDDLPQGDESDVVLYPPSLPGAHASVLEIYVKSGNSRRK